jgi:hypothetical protein
MAQVPLNTDKKTAPNATFNSDDTTKYRILSIFPKTIELDELSLPGNETSKTQKAEDTISIEFPLIRINDYIFNRDEIINMTIDCTDFLPKIVLNVMFIHQAFLTKDVPKDGDVISLALRSKSDSLKMIRNDYVITNVHTLPNYTDAKTPVKMTIYGELFIPGLKSQMQDFSFEGTTYEAAMDFAKKTGLGFATNEDNTDDKQIWLKANMAGDIYINNLVDRAWKDKQSFFKCWIDLYYNLNFININKQLLSAETEVDIASKIDNLDKNWNFGSNSEPEKAVPMVKVFSNILSYKTTSFFIKTWRPFNKSSIITFKLGTKMVCEMFEHNKNIYEDPQKKKYWRIGIEPAYDPEKSNKMILLRGRTPYRNVEGNTDLARANYPYVNLYEKYPWLGVQYTISNPDDDNLQWDGNHHKNYHVARVQNLINNKELDKLNLHIEVIGNNFNIIKGDKVPVLLIKTDPFDNIKINPQAGLNEMLDLFYSGWYLVKGFILTYNNNDNNNTKQSVFSNFVQEFILTRREWPAPVPVEPVKTEI